MSDIEYSVITSDVIKSFDCINGHMTKMASIPIKCKTNPLKSPSLGTNDQWPWDSKVCNIGDVGSTRYAQLMNLG